MRKITVLSILLIFTAAVSSVFAQGTSTSIQLGWFSPQATETGFIIGLGQSKVFDEKVELGISLDFFNNKYTDEKTVAVDTTGTGTNINTRQASLETNTMMFPLMANLTIKIPVVFPLEPYISGSLGYVLLWDNYKNYEDNVEETKFFSGFAWRASAGLAYQLGSRSDITAEVMYIGAKPSRSEGEENGLPTWTEVDMSGLAFRLGVRLYVF